MEAAKHIDKILKKNGRITTNDLVDKTGFSRAYAQRFLKKMVEEGTLLRIGKANQAHYVPARRRGKPPAKPMRIRKILTNEGLSETKIMNRIQEESSVFAGLPGTVASVALYALTELLKNAVKHSASEKIDLQALKTPTELHFTVKDWGVGIFNSIMQKKRLVSTGDAVQKLLKRRPAIAPEPGSRQAVLTISKIADRLTIASFEKKVVFDNLQDKIFVREIEPAQGTRVDFILKLKTPAKPVKKASRPLRKASAR
ncbi:MAG: DUF977 family protein [Smithellaceae bacterium]|nr:DUF977 family protein [Syntrophaceae bacterium]MDD4240187.1 DUF977 family protein [Smithellaceae bacterium]NLX51387.1 DUF977 family protein [Deltaproteobacteria bacterium]